MTGGGKRQVLWRTACAEASTSSGLASGPVRCEGNAALVGALRRMQEGLRQEARDKGVEEGHAVRTLAGAEMSLRGLGMRLRSAAMAKELNEGKLLEGFGPWIIGLVAAFFERWPAEEASPVELAAEEAARAMTKGVRKKQRKERALEKSADAAGGGGDGAARKRQKKQYEPKFRTGAFAVLVTLDRAHREGSEHLETAELKRRAEASGLSATSFYPVAAGNFDSRSGNSAQNFYTAWSGIAPLINKHCYVHAWSNPKKFRLTPEGAKVAEKLHRAVEGRECHCGLLPPLGAEGDDGGPQPNAAGEGMAWGVSSQTTSGRIFDSNSMPGTRKTVSPSPRTMSPRPAPAVDTSMSREQKKAVSMSWATKMVRDVAAGAVKVSTATAAAAAVAPASNTSDVINLLSDEEEEVAQQGKPGIIAAPCRVHTQDAVEVVEISQRTNVGSKSRIIPRSTSGTAGPGIVGGENVRDCPPPPKPSTSQLPKSRDASSLIKWRLPLLNQEMNCRLPPLPAGRRFGEVYSVILLLDNREQFFRTGRGRVGSLNDHLDTIRATGVAVESRSLPIGDTIWIARSKFNPAEEYVLDYIIERKRTDDLWQSITNGRYKKQKFWLRRCGLRNLIYLCEGNIDASNNAQALRTALAQTEIVDGFKVLRFENAAETFKFYGIMSAAIARQYSSLEACPNQRESGETAMPFDMFVSGLRVRQQNSVSVRSVLYQMLLEVPRIGPGAAEAIVAKYPTPRQLLERLSHESTENAHRVISSLRIGDTQSIGDVGGRNVVKYFLNASALDYHHS